LNKIQKSPKIFFGWWTVLACGVVGFLEVGFGSMGFSVLFKPIAAELGLDRAATSIASGIQNAVGGIIGLIGGQASDKYGPRRIILIGTIIMVLGCIMMYFVNSLWFFIFAWGIAVGAGYNLGATLITDRAIVNWFIKKSGIAISVKFAIQALAGLMLLPVIALLVTNQGWRNTCIIAGIVIAVIAIPLVWFLVRPHRPEYYGLRADGITKSVIEINQPANKNVNYSIGSEEKDFTLKQTAKTSAYWLIVILGFMSGFAMTMMGTHFIPFLTDRGIAPVQAASMMGLLVTVGIPARLATGFFVDRIKTDYLRFMMAAGIFIQAIGIIIFLVNQSTPTIYVWLLSYSIGSGISQAVSLPLQALYFGRKAFGSIIGLSSAIQMPIGLAAPMYVGWVYDTSGSYMSVILILAILLAISGVIACFVRRPKLPGRVTDTLKTVY
jgi:MFS family permease